MQTLATRSFVRIIESGLTGLGWPVLRVVGIIHHAADEAAAKEAFPKASIVSFQNAADVFAARYWFGGFK